MKTFFWSGIGFCWGLMAAGLLAGCDAKYDIKAEEEPVRFAQTNLTRFTMERETTPLGYPHLYLIKDSAGNSEILYITRHDNDGCAIKIK